MRVHLALLAALFLIAALAASRCHAAHFDLGTKYTYHIKSRIDSSSDISQSVTSVGGSLNAQASGDASLLFDADFEIVPLSVNGSGETNCSLVFVGRVPVIDIVTSHAQLPQQTLSATGKLDFNRWFSFAINAEGIIVAYFHEPTEPREVVAFKKGVANQFSARVVEPGGGLRKRSFEAEEHDVSGKHLATYFVSQGNHPHNVVYTKRSVPILEPGQSDSSITRSGEKVLVKNEHLGHVVKITHQDEFAMASASKVREQGKSICAQTMGVGREAAVIVVKFKLTSQDDPSQQPVVAESAPPVQLISTPVYVAPPPILYSLPEALLQIDKSMTCFDDSIINSNIQMSTGEKGKCFQRARTVITHLNTRDANETLGYLINRYSAGGRRWVVFELAGELCRSNPELMDDVLRLTASRIRRVPANDADPILNEFAGSAGNETLAALLHDRIQLRLMTDIKADVYAHAGANSSTPNVHKEAFLASSQAAKHATMLLALGNTQRPSAATTLENVLLPNHTQAYPIVVYQYAAHALGLMEGEKVENILLSAMVRHHPDVSRAARAAYHIKKRSIEIDDLVTGVDELQEMDVIDDSQSLHARTLRARGFVNYHRRDIDSGSKHFALAAPSFNWDKKFGPDLVGVHVQARAINSVSLDLSLISSALSIQVDNTASASLYVDIGGYQELPIFSAALQFIASVGYDMDMLKNFKLSDVANIEETFKKAYGEVTTDLKIAIQFAQTAWGDLVTAVHYIEHLANDLASTDWTSILQTVPSSDDDLNAIISVFSDTVADLKQCGQNVKTIAITAFNQVVANVTVGLENVVGGIESIANCPQQAVGGIIAGIQDIEAAFWVAENALESLRLLLSPDSIMSSFPMLDEDFMDFISSSSNSTEAVYFSKAVEMYRNVSSIMATAESDVHAYLSKFKRTYTNVYLSYHKMKSVFDSVFGPKFHLKFPSKIAAATDGSALGFPMGGWTDSQAFAYNGLQVQSTSGETVVCPMAGAYYTVDSTTFKLSITENSLKGYNIFFTGITANKSLSDGVACRKGQIIGQTKSAGIIGIAISKKTNARDFVDPTKYLARRTPSIIGPLHPTANSYSLTAVGYSILPVTPLIDLASFGESATTGKSSSAGLARRDDFVPTNVCDVDEFKNPSSALCGGGTLPEERKSILLYKIEEFFLVAGFIPITFSLEFDAIIGISASLKMCLMDLSVNPVITPEFAIAMSGSLSLGIGGVLSAGLTATGIVADTHVPISGHFPLSTVPAGVCLNVDMIIVPLTLTLSIDVTIVLIHYSAPLVTFTDVEQQFKADAMTLNILDTCPAPGLVVRDQAAFLLDSTPPVFSAVEAFQVIGQTAAAPLIYARFAANDPESGIKSLAVSVGRSPGDDSIVPTRVVPLDQGESLTMLGPTDVSYDEKIIFVSFYAMNQQNLTSIAAVSILYDISPPVIVIKDDYSGLSLHQHPLDGNEVRSALRKSLQPYTLALADQLDGTSFSGFPDQLCFTFTITDATAISSVKYAIGTGSLTPNNAMDWKSPTNFSPLAMVCENNLDLSQGITYFLTVVAQNALNYTTTMTSRGTTVDLTPPEPGNIFFGTIPGAISNGTQIQNVAFITFSGFKDVESDAAWWRAAIGPSSATPEEIAAHPGKWVTAPLSSWTAPVKFSNPPVYVQAPITAVSLPEGNHTVCIQVQNFVGRQTTNCRAGYIVDLTAPSGNATIDADGFEVTISLQYADNLSGVRYVWVALGDGEEPVFSDWQKFDLSQTDNVATATFEVGADMNGVQVYGQLILFDYAENVLRIPTMNFLQLDLLPPVAGQVFDGAFWQEVPFINGSTLCASYDEWQDAVTGIGSYDISFGSSPGFDDIASVQGLSPDTHSYCTQNVTAVVDGQQIFVTVTGWNLKHSLSSTATSTGTLVDVSPPLPFNVTIVTPNGSNFTRELGHVFVSWTTAVDPQSSVNSYLVALFKTVIVSGVQVNTTIVDYVDLNPANPLFTSANVYGAPIVDGDVIFASVQAFNRAGGSRAVASQTVLVSTSRPILHESYFQANFSAGSLTYVLSATEVDLLWTWQSGSPVVYACDVLAKSDGIAAPTVVTRADATGCYVTAAPPLAEGGIYTIILSATTSAGVTEEVWKDFTVATQRPVFVSGGCGSDIINTPNVTTTTWAQTLRAWWTFDQGSAPITGYSYAFGSQSGFTDYTGSKWIDTSVPFADIAPSVPLALQNVYFVSIKARNEAGFVSMPVLFDLGTKLVDGAISGAVIDGPGVEASYQENADMVTASFAGFKASEGILGAAYEWGLGTQPRQTNVVAFSTAGLLVSDVSGSGTIVYPVALTAATYYVSVRATFGGTPLQVVQSSSRGFRVINRPPSTGFSSSGVTYLPANDKLLLECVGNDAAGTLNSMGIQVGTMPWALHDSALTEYFNPVASRALATTVTHISAPDGVTLFSQCNARNAIPDLIGVSDGPQLVFDSTPPSPPVGVSCTVTVVSPTGFFTCSWTEAVDVESGIFSYSATVGITIGGSEFETFTDVSGGRIFVNMQTYYASNRAPPPAVYVSVQATNGVGMNASSAPVIVQVDSTAPTADASLIRIVSPHASKLANGTLRTSKSADCQSSTASMRVDWTGAFQDLDSGIALYEGSVEMRVIAPDGSQQSRTLRKMSRVGNAALGITVDTLSFEQQAVVNCLLIAIIKATNGAGLSSALRANISVVDRGPQPLVVQQALSTSSNASSFAIGSNLLRANWQWSHPCPIVLYRATVIEVDTGTAMYGPNFTNLTSFSVTNLALEPNRTYKTTVDAWNSLGMIGTLGVSDGTSIIWTPARPGAVYQGSLSKVDQQVFVNSTFLAASWDAFDSASCLVQGYEWAVGSDTSSLTGQTDVLPFTNVGLAQNASFNLPAPVALFTQYYVTVRAVDCTSNTLYAYSGGFHMGQEVPPQMPAVFLGSQGSDSWAQDSADVVTVAWSGASSIWSAVDTYVGLGVASDPLIPVLWPFTQVPSTESSFTFTGLSLKQLNISQAGTAKNVVANITSNTSTTSDTSTSDYSIQKREITSVSVPYSIIVRVQDRSGQSTTANRLFVVDQTPPIPGTITLQNQGVNDSVVWQAFASNITFALSGAADPESDVARMAYRVENNATGAALLDWTPFQIANAAVIYTQLDVATPYIIRLRVTNGAGLSSETQSIPLAVDITPPVFGDLNLGTDMSAGIQYLSSRAIIPWTLAVSTNANGVLCTSSADDFTNVNASKAWTPTGCSAGTTSQGLSIKAGCQWSSTVYGSGSPFVVRMKASNSTGAVSTIVITDSTFPVVFEPVPAANNDTVISNAAFPYTALGIAVSAGAVPSVAVWRTDKGEKVWRQKSFNLQIDPTLSFISYTVIILRSGLTITAADDAGNLQGSMTMAALPSGVSFLDKLPRMAARLRLWNVNAPKTTDTMMTVSGATYPTASHLPCNYAAVTNDLESGITRYQIGLGTAHGLTDIMNLTDILATDVEPNGCLGDDCYFSERIDTSTGVKTKRINLDLSLSAVPGLIPARYVPNWCSLTVLQGGCATLASCNPVASPQTGLNFTCNCPKGFTGTGVGPNGCVDVDEVAAATARGISLCGPNAKARNVPGTIVCDCRPGYQGHPYNMTDGCVNIDECQTDPQRCGAGGVCQDLPGTWACRCRAGFAIADAKEQSCTAINNCPGNCSALATCANTAPGQYACQCATGLRGSGLGMDCAAAGSTCATNAPVALNSSFASNLTVDVDRVPGMTTRLLKFSPTLLAKWYSVKSNGRGVSLNVTSTAILSGSLTVYMTGDCLGNDNVPISCNAKGMYCTGQYLAPAGHQFFFAVSAIIPANFTIRIQILPPTTCSMACLNGGTCSYPGPTCVCASGWTGSDCSVPSLSMLPRKATTNFTCQTPYGYSGIVYNAGNPCSSTVLPGTVAPPNASYTFQGCFGSFWLWSADEPEPPRLALDMISSTVALGGTLQQCANTCRAAGTTLFSYHQAPSTFYSFYWPNVNSKTTSCLCMPFLPSTASSTSMTTCRNASRTWASSLGGVPVFAVTPPAAWCPVAETLSANTNLSATFNTPATCASRTTVGGSACVFPFVYRGMQHTECTSIDDIAPWCFTDVVQKRRDYCSGVDYCSSSTQKCAANSTCVSGPANAQCVCNRGYAANSTIGPGCYDVDECAQNPNLCDQRGYCQNTIGSYSCGCNATLGMFIDPVDNRTCYWLPDNSPQIENQAVIPTAPNNTKISIPYFVAFKLFNSANLSTQYYPKSFIIDEDPPVLNNVATWTRGQQVSVLSPGNITTTWDFSSPSSGIAYYEYWMGTSRFGAEVMPKTVTVNKNVTFALTAPQLSTYYFSITAFSGALLNTSASFPIVVAIVGPTAAGVTASLFSYGRAIAWSGSFTDPVGVTQIYAAIGTRPGLSDLLSWTQVADAALSNATLLGDSTCSDCLAASSYLPATFSTFATPVFFSVRAVNRAGLFGTAVTAPPALLLGTSAQILSGNSTISIGGFSASTAMLTLSGNIGSIYRVTAIAMNSMQYQFAAKYGAITPVPPPFLTIYRVGSTTVKFLQVHALVASVSANAALPSTMPNVSAACQIPGITVTGASKPVVYFSAYNSTGWAAQKTTVDPTTGIARWFATVPGFYGLFLNTTVPSYLDVNMDAVADILLTNGKGVYYVALSPSWTAFPVFFNLTGSKVLAISDFDGDGIMDVALAGTTTVLSYLDGSGKVRKSDTAVAPSIPAGAKRFKIAPTILGASDVDEDLVPDLIWTAEVDSGIPVLFVQPSKLGNYSRPGQMTVRLPYSDPIVGLGSWGTRTGVLCSSRTGQKVIFYTLDLRTSTTIYADGTSSSVPTGFSAAAVLGTTISVLPGQVWTAQVVGDMNGDGVSDLVLRCTSSYYNCAPGSLAATMVVWYLGPVGQVLATGTLPLAANALGVGVQL
ncbi:hypothetical protein HDU88_002540 [Geranomyces variabilis]|nr:hypothetical protein HDU88_002540 [Geranomyces variabilis]